MNNEYICEMYAYLILIASGDHPEVLEQLEHVGCHFLFSNINEDPSRLPHRTYSPQLSPSYFSFPFSFRFFFCDLHIPLLLASNNSRSLGAAKSARALPVGPHRFLISLPHEAISNGAQSLRRREDSGRRRDTVIKRHHEGPPSTPGVSATNSLGEAAACVRSPRPRCARSQLAVLSSPVVRSAAPCWNRRFPLFLFFCTRPDREAQWPIGFDHHAPYL